jgi:23S rRNA (pseudouridine1915-N3)-methyltransferase
MRIKVLSVGKTEENYLKEGIAVYCKKLTHYFPFTYEEIPLGRQAKHFGRDEQKKREGELILKKTASSDILVLLDETGEVYSSVDFSVFLQQQMLQNNKQLVFVTGGAYGFSPEVYNQKSFLISLSRMTFSHQMVRLILLEQLYRAASILKNEPYHHG